MSWFSEKALEQLWFCHRCRLVFFDRSVSCGECRQPLENVMKEVRDQYARRSTR